MYEKIAEELLNRLAKAITEYDADSASDLTIDLLSRGIDPKRIINDGLSKGIQEVSDKFNRLEVFLPHMIFAADAMQIAVHKIIESLPPDRKHEVILGKVVLGTVKGDIHDVGKNIFKTMLLATGFEVYDLGVDVPTEYFINRAEEIKADIIALSCLMTTCLIQLKEVIEDLVRLKIRNKYKVLVGGGAVTETFAHKVAADGYSLDAIAGAGLAKKILGKE
ncbi:MAG: cobalamin B12-binding domain-containing protein [Syntrophaceae bacterium]|nr:cobalamin B12-binding domain-containing protein [Syntrophaceae bacterium]